MTARSSRVAIAAGVVFIAALAFAIAWGPLGQVFEREVGTWQNALAARLSGPGALYGWHLYAVAFAGGLVASVSPCILGMLPVNLSYIGAAKLGSRTAAVRVAGAFVSSLFFALFVLYRGPLNIGVGLIMVAMGFGLVGVLRVPVPQIATR